MKRDHRRLALALSALLAGAAFAAPAGAQFAGGRTAFDARERAGLVQPVQFRDFFRPLWGGGGGGWGERYYPNNSYDPYNPFNQRQQTYEAIKPPAPRKVDTPPAETVLVIGDSLADWLGYGLEEALTDTPQVGIVRKIRPYSGLVRYEARADAPDWSQAVKDVLAPEKPAAIVVMLGTNDRLPLRDHAPPPKSATPAPQGQGATAPGTTPAADATPPDADQPPAAANEAARRPPPAGGNYEFHTDKWAELYEKRIDEMIAALKSKGVPVLWVGLPAIRGTKSTSDMLYLDELYRARAEKAGIVYVDIWDGFVDDQGRYAQQGPDFQGQTRRLRTYDGVNFTKSGAEKLAHYVEHELRRVLTSHVVPVALARNRRSARSFRWARSAAATAASFLAPAVRRRRKPTRWQRAYSPAAMRWPRRPGAPTISPGRVPMPRSRERRRLRRHRLRRRRPDLRLPRRALPARANQIKATRAKTTRARTTRARTSQRRRARPRRSRLRRPLRRPRRRSRRPNRGSRALSSTARRRGRLCRSVLPPPGSGSFPPPLWGRVGRGVARWREGVADCERPNDPHPYPSPQGGGERDYRGNKLDPIRNVSTACAA